MISERCETNAVSLVTAPSMSFFLEKVLRLRHRGGTRQKNLCSSLVQEMELGVQGDQRARIHRVPEGKAAQRNNCRDLHKVYLECQSAYAGENTSQAQGKNHPKDLRE